MFQIDHYAYANRLLPVHPGEKLAFAVVTMAICLAFSSPATSLAVIALMSGALVLRAGIPWPAYLRLLAVPAGFLLIGTVTIAVSVGGQPDGQSWGINAPGVWIGVGERDLALAAGLFLKSLGATTCMYFLALTTPMVEVVSILKKLKAPSLFVELMTIIYRFIFVLAETANSIYTSQSSRLGYRNIRTGYGSLAGLVTNLFVKAYYRSRMLFITLSARGYTGELRVLEPGHRLSKKNILVIAVLDLLLAALGLVNHNILPWRDIFF